MRMFRHVGGPYLQRLSTRYLERPRRGQPARPPVRSLWRFGASSHLLFAREGKYAELRRKKDLITVRPLCTYYRY